MKYYKIIKNNEIIGIINSNDFIAFQPVTQCFLRSDEQQGEFVSYNGSLYRDSWMKPITWQINYTIAQIIEIDEAIYNIFINAIANNEEPQEETPLPEPDIIVDPNNIVSLEYIRESKIKEMSNACHATIENGFDLELRGETRHFSLTTQDQLNLMSLSAMAQTQQLIPYHADGEVCEFYTADEINQIISAANTLKNYNTVYYNALKTYINALETIEEISAITYGIEIPEEYKSDVLKVLEY